jgi:translation initiation factor IF-1
MAELVPFRLQLTGDTADQHQFQGYDGYMALAGFAWTLALVANYSETGQIRHRGDFPGRHAVRATAPAEGSVIADFMVWLQQNPANILHLGGGGLAGSVFFYDLVRRVIARNLGNETAPQDPMLQKLVATHDGDVEALVASTEAAIRQSHSVIGNGATEVKILGGHNVIAKFDEETRDYVKLNVEDSEVRTRDFSVAAFNVNSGYGSVFDDGIGRTIPISMARDVLRVARSVFTWGLDQYANRTGGKIRVKYTRILAMDGTPKRYIILTAERA